MGAELPQLLGGHLATRSKDSGVHDRKNRVMEQARSRRRIELAAQAACFVRAPDELSHELDLRPEPPIEIAGARLGQSGGESRQRTRHGAAWGCEIEESVD